MTGANLSEADLSGARLGGDFEEANLSGANLSGVDAAPDMENQSMA